MSRLIDADKLSIDATIATPMGSISYVSIAQIKNAPTVETKKGKWEPLTHDYIFGSGNHEITFYSCSICHEMVDEVNIREDDYSFCPNCGADMRDETNG